MHVDKNNKILHEGNANMLTRHFQVVKGKVDLKVAFFGDHLLEDVQATHEFTKNMKETGGRSRWDAFPVIEEFASEDKAYE